ncbi:LytR family transcriptional regulator [Lysinibacillus sp. 2017]|uniref:LCP family glycopolymer transferase n=1 Tax=unclassified Lysinibacillus TaxID=2636778 RepID=UPI000D5268C2|nr:MULTISPECIES: LCP family protein [unclassified Lysinibacillus]AWE06750.1 LytR family transcriptional regulator [Lysinibacillus sp. 2017]TGN37318.1 LytR family transcriptional regulator [Lysinibacillus sp. S2017]
MKKIWKWVVGIALVLCIASVAFLINVYGDIKSTADEIYSPINDEIPIPAIRSEPVDITSKKEPFSALILGVDEREDDTGRSDTMIVLTVNPSLQTTKMLSIPRDTYTEMVGKGYKDKINHAYAFGGVEMSMKTVENLLEIPIDYVSQVNMESFVDIIEIVGGITVDNTLDFNFDGEHFSIGELSLDGEEALKYVRMRYEDPAGDFGRQNRQKQVIQGVLKESLSLNTLWNYKSIFKTLEENVEMNVSFDDLLSIRKNYGNSFKTIEQLYLNNGTGTMMNGIYYYMPNESELHDIQENLKQHMEIKE